MRLAGSVGEWHAPAGRTAQSGVCGAADRCRTARRRPDSRGCSVCIRRCGCGCRGCTASCSKRGPRRPIGRSAPCRATSRITARRTSASGPTGGAIAPGGRLELTGGNVSVHDDAGRPIDAAATVSAFVALMTAFPALVAKDFSVATAPNVAELAARTVCERPHDRRSARAADVAVRRPVHQRRYEAHERDRGERGVRHVPVEQPRRSRSWSSSVAAESQRAARRRAGDVRHARPDVHDPAARRRPCRSRSSDATSSACSWTT